MAETVQRDGAPSDTAWCSRSRRSNRASASYRGRASRNRGQNQAAGRDYRTSGSPEEACPRPIRRPPDLYMIIVRLKAWRAKSTEMSAGLMRPRYRGVRLLALPARRALFDESARAFL